MIEDDVKRLKDNFSQTGQALRLIIDQVQKLKDQFIQRLAAIEAEERQIVDALERVRTARIAQEGAIRGLEILLEQATVTSETDST